MYPPRYIARQKSRCEDDQAIEPGFGNIANAALPLARAGPSVTMDIHSVSGTNEADSAAGLASGTITPPTAGESPSASYPPSEISHDGGSLLNNANTGATTVVPHLPQASQMS